MTRKPTPRTAALAAAALALACSSSPTTQSYKTLQLTGVYDLARVNDLIFALVADRDLIHVLDVSKSPREFVKAPNPIEPLAIPVLPHPVNLVLDVHYDANGAEVAGPYLYVQNPALAQLSVVHACALKAGTSGVTCDARDPDVLKEVVRLTASGPVTAVSAAGAAAPDGSSTLYYATRDGDVAHLWSVSLPATGLAASGAPAPTQLLEASAATITALQVLGRADQVVVAMRDDAAGTTCPASPEATTHACTFVLDTAANTFAALSFPAPVRMLRTNPRTSVLEAGTNAYGVLDETSCGGGDSCRGIVVVNTFTGNVVTDVSGATMIPIRWGDALPISLELVPSGPVPAFVGDAPTSSFKPDLTGLATLSNGGVGVFNAGTGDPTSYRVLDQDPGAESPPSTDPVAQQAALAYQDPSGHVLPYEAGISPPTVTVGSGTVRTETVAAVYQGVVPGFERVPLDAAAPVPTTYAVDPALLAPCSGLPAGAVVDPEQCVRVRPGDLVELQGGCQAELTVTSVAAASFDTSALPPGCAGATGYSLRAGPERPLVISGTFSGFMGRWAPDPNTIFRFYAPVWYRTPSFSPAATIPAAVQFVVPSLPADIQRDSQYRLAVGSGFSPEEIRIGRLSSNMIDRLPMTGPPGGVVYYLTVGSFFVSYPADGMIAELLEGDTALNLVNLATLHY